MKRFIKWFGLGIIAVATIGFLTFLYLIPPFSLMKPEEFSDPIRKAGPDLSTIPDPAERMMAERGRYLMTVGACSECHSTPGDQGPDTQHKYLAGGARLMRRGQGRYVSMNLTPDRGTGIGALGDDDLERVWRHGLGPDGHSVPGFLMPWPAYSNWTDEDMHAVLVYLRHTVPIVHRIPAPAGESFTDRTSLEEDYFGKDYGETASK